MIDHALRTAGATRNLLSEPAAELIFRACRGLPRLASKLLHAALIAADARDRCPSRSGMSAQVSPENAGQGEYVLLLAYVTTVQGEHVRSC